MINEESIIQTKDIFDKTEELDKYYIVEESSKEAKDIANKFINNLDYKDKKEYKKIAKTNKNIDKYLNKTLKKKKVKIYKNPYVKTSSKFTHKIKNFFKVLYIDFVNII